MSDSGKFFLKEIINEDYSISKDSNHTKIKKTGLGDIVWQHDSFAGNFVFKLGGKNNHSNGTDGAGVFDIQSADGQSRFKIDPAGHLTLTGDTTANTTITDSIIGLNNGTTGANSNDCGIIIERGTTGDNAFIGWDESEDKFILGTTTETAASTGNLTNFTNGDLVIANMTATGDIILDDGGSLKEAGGTARTG